MLLVAKFILFSLGQTRSRKAKSNEKKLSPPHCMSLLKLSLKVQQCKMKLVYGRKIDENLVGLRTIFTVGGISSWKKYITRRKCQWCRRIGEQIFPVLGK